MNNGLLHSWRANFLTGFAVVLPGAISIAIVVWIFRNLSTITDTLLFFLPDEWTHTQGGLGPVRWYWSLFSFIFTLLLIALVGQITRYYVGKQMISWMDQVLLRVPLLNKVYGMIKQVNESFASSSKSSFKQAVVVEFPHPGCYTIGFLTSSEPGVVASQTESALLSVFVPTTPNPTSGFLIMVPADKVRKLEMPVAEAVRHIISLGTLPPGGRSQDIPKPG